MAEVAPSCALFGAFAIGARVSLLWENTRQMRNVSEDAIAVWLVSHDVDKLCVAGKTIMPLTPAIYRAL